MSALLVVSKEVAREIGKLFTLCNNVNGGKPLPVCGKNSVGILSRFFWNRPVFFYEIM